MGSYHEKIKFIYDFLVAKNIGDIWVMSGGGMQIQAFFGNSTGYLGILYLNLDSKKATPKSKQTFIVNWANNDKLFKEKRTREEFLLHKIELKLSAEVYPLKILKIFWLFVAFPHFITF